MEMEEFKKRMKDRLCWSTGTLFNFLEKETRIITESDFEIMFRIFDEARNEWPTEEMASKILRERTDMPHDKHWEGGLAEAAKQQILASLRQDWFLKWLANMNEIVEMS